MTERLHFLLLSYFWINTYPTKTCTYFHQKDRHSSRFKQHNFKVPSNWEHQKSHQWWSGKMGLYYTTEYYAVTKTNNVCVSHRQSSRHKTTQLIPNRCLLHHSMYRKYRGEHNSFMLFKEVETGSHRKGRGRGRVPGCQERSFLDLCANQICADQIRCKKSASSIPWRYIHIYTFLYVFSKIPLIHPQTAAQNLLLW